MKTLVFLGPTLNLAEARAILPEAIFLPPARCGDLLRALEYKPDCIALIDGYFEKTAAVWHKEILELLHQGIFVFGASSMGALRAAELSFFGMKGVGKIYKAYQSRELEDDDEVVLVHASAQEHYRKLTEPMVNVRETLLTAALTGQLSEQKAIELIKFAKSVYYKERTWEKVLSFLAHDEAVRLSTWVQQGHYVDQKAVDAKELLVQLTQLTDFPKVPVFHLNRTVFLERLCDQIKFRPENFLSETHSVHPKLAKIYVQVYKTMVRLKLTESLVLTDQSQIEQMQSTLLKLLQLPFSELAAENRQCVLQLSRYLILLEQYLTEEGLIPNRVHMEALQRKIQRQFSSEIEPTQLYLMAQVYFMCQEFCAQSSELFLQPIREYWLVHGR